VKTQLKIANIFPPRVFCVPAEGVPLGIGYRHRESKIEWWGYLPGRTRSLTTSLAVWIQPTKVTDRRTDDSKDRA